MPSTFDGFPWPKRPFDEVEAQDVLNSLTSALRARLATSTLLAPIKALPPAARIGTELGWRGAWDVIPFQFGGDDEFTNHPHLGIWISSQEAVISVVLPNGAARYWKGVMSRDAAPFTGALKQVWERIRPLRAPLRSGVVEPRLVIQILQRHYHARRNAVWDGCLYFDLDVLFPGEHSEVKMLSSWLPALRAVLAESKQANMELDLTVCYPFRDGSVTQSARFVDSAVRAVEALQPFLELLMGEERH